VPYYPVRDEALKTIVRLKLNKIAGRMMENNRVLLSFGEDVVGSVARRCAEVETGARNVDNILTNTVLPEVSRRLLSGVAAGVPVSEVLLAQAVDGGVGYTVR